MALDTNTVYLFFNLSDIMPLLIIFGFGLLLGAKLHKVKNNPNDYQDVHQAYQQFKDGLHS